LLVQGYLEGIDIDITNVSVPIEDVAVPSVTVAVLRQHWPALLWLLQWAWRRI